MSEETNLQDNGGPQSKFGKWYAANRERRIEYMRNYRANNRENVRAYSREHNARQRKVRPEMFMLGNAKHRAKERGQPCTITEKDIVIPSHCPLLGLPLEAQSGVLAHNSPSLDRIDPALGYVPGNVWVISHRANSMKNDARPAELLVFAKAVLAHFKEGANMAEETQPVEQQSEQLELDFFSDAPLTTGYVCTDEICESCQ